MTLRGLVLAGLLGLAACEDADPVEPPVAAPPEQHYLYGLATNYWSNPTINVCWENAGNATEKGWVEDELTGPNSWSAFSDVEFVGWGDCTSSSTGIRITSGSSMVVSGLGDQGGTSEMELDFTATPQNTWARCVNNSLSREACIRAVALHEFGHSLGFAHEHNRPDETACTFANAGSNGDTLIGEYDAVSIMNYCGNATTLSQTDELGVNSAYGGPFPGWSPCDSTTPCPTKTGDCDNDDECALDTTCVHDVGDLFGWTTTVDVCANPGDVPFPGWGRCTSTSPCANFVGDCDSDSDCAAGTRCVRDVGAVFGWSASVDVCVEPGTLPFPGWDFCRDNGFSCDEGVGDCEDGQCGTDLTCSQNVGANYGWSASADVCERLEWSYAGASFCAGLCPATGDCSCITDICPANVGFGLPCDLADGDPCWELPIFGSGTIADKWSCNLVEPPVQ